MIDDAGHAGPSKGRQPAGARLCAVETLRYATTPDGAQVCFRVVPGGPGAPLVYLPGLLYSIESIFEDPPYARFIDGLAGLGPVVLMERQGVAASDPLDPARDVWEQWVADVVAVLDEMEIERAALVGYAIGATIALEAALRHPTRVSGVVAMHAMVATSEEVADGARELNQRVVARDEAAAEDAWALSMPSRASEPGFAEWFRRAGRLAASPSTAAMLWDRVLRVNDLDERMVDIGVPVLLIDRRAYVEASLGPIASREALVGGMAHARHVTLEGADLIPNAGDVDEVLFEIGDFLIGDRGGAASTRLLTTVLFSDLVSSTEAARSHGDDAWRAVLEHHDQLTERCVRRHGGTILKSTGDGVLAIFDSPSRALRCALAIREAIGGVGMQVRIGLHLGEVERHGDDVAGVAVHLAARVMASAGSGEILTTAGIPLATVGSGLAFARRGAVALKGFDDDVELFRLVSEV